MSGGGLWSLVLGLMLTIFGGFALCYGFVRLAETIVRSLHRTRSAPVSVPPVRRAA
jgi:hypothetical protein